MDALGRQGVGAELWILGGPITRWSVTGLAAGGWRSPWRRGASPLLAAWRDPKNRQKRTLLGHQLVVASRKVNSRAFRPHEPCLPMRNARLVLRWGSALLRVSPKTVPRWRRAEFRRFSGRRSKANGQRHLRSVLTELAIGYFDIA